MPYEQKKAEEKESPQDKGSLRVEMDSWYKNKLKDLDYQERQQAMQDSFTTALYGKRDIGAERVKLEKEMGKHTENFGAESGKKAAMNVADDAGSQTPEAVQRAIDQEKMDDPGQYNDRMDDINRQKDWDEVKGAAGKKWDETVEKEREAWQDAKELPGKVTDRLGGYAEKLGQTAKEMGGKLADTVGGWFKKDEAKPKTPVREGYFRPQPIEKGQILRSWEQIKPDAKTGKMDPSGITKEEWSGMIEQSDKRLAEAIKNPPENGYCNIYVQNRLLKDGIYTKPNEVANDFKKRVDGDKDSWEKIPKTPPATEGGTERLDQHAAYEAAKNRDRVIAVHNGGTGPGHVVIVNAEREMKPSNNWGGNVVAVDGYNNTREEKGVYIGDKLSDQFGLDKEPNMDFYRYIGPRAELGSNAPNAEPNAKPKDEVDKKKAK